MSFQISIYQALVDSGCNQTVAVEGWLSISCGQRGGWLKSVPTLFSKVRQRISSNSCGHNSPVSAHIMLTKMGPQDNPKYRCAVEACYWLSFQWSACCCACWEGPGHVPTPPAPTCWNTWTSSTWIIQWVNRTPEQHCQCFHVLFHVPSAIFPDVANVSR